MAKKLKSGIVGQAQVIFGGAIKMSLGTIKDADQDVLAVGMAELKHPEAKAGDPIINGDTYNGEQRFPMCVTKEIITKSIRNV